MRSALFRRVPADPPISKFCMTAKPSRWPSGAVRRPNGSRCASRTRPARSCSPSPSAPMSASPRDSPTATASGSPPGSPRCRSGSIFEPAPWCPSRRPHRIVHWSTIRGVTQATRAAPASRSSPSRGEATASGAAGAGVPRGGGQEGFRRRRETHTAKLGIAAKRITVRDTKSRWGSCSASGALNFSWRLILAPPFVLDYLAAPRGGASARAQPLHRFWRRSPTSSAPAPTRRKAGSSATAATLHRIG